MNSVTLNERPYSDRKAIIPSQILGVFFLIFTELMLFTAFLSAYFVSRASLLSWPPEGQPRLSILETGFNTIILLLSAVMMYKCVSEFNKTKMWSSLSQRWMKLTIIFGLLFIIGQGREWIHLVSFGLTTQSNLFMSHFYTIVGMHALHVTAAVLAAIWFYFQEKPKQNGLRALSYYWYFVVGLWPILYTLVYLV